MRNSSKNFQEVFLGIPVRFPLGIFQGVSFGKFSRNVFGKFTRCSTGKFSIWNSSQSSIVKFSKSFVFEFFSRFFYMKNIRVPSWIPAEVPLGIFPGVSSGFLSGVSTRVSPTAILEVSWVFWKLLQEFLQGVFGIVLKLFYDYFSRISSNNYFRKFLKIYQVFLLSENPPYGFIRNSSRSSIGFFSRRYIGNFSKSSLENYSRNWLEIFPKSCLRKFVFIESHVPKQLFILIYFLGFLTGPCLNILIQDKP